MVCLFIFCALRMMGLYSVSLSMGLNPACMIVFRRSFVVVSWCVPTPASLVISYHTTVPSMSFTPALSVIWAMGNVCMGQKTLTCWKLSSMSLATASILRFSKPEGPGRCWSWLPSGKKGSGMMVWNLPGVLFCMARSCSSLSRQKCLTRSCKDSMWPYSIVAFVMSPSLCAWRWTCSHWSDLILPLNAWSCMRSSKTSAPPPGSESSPASLRSLSIACMSFPLLLMRARCTISTAVNALRCRCGNFSLIALSICV